MILLWYPKCSTCRRALSYLEERKVSVSLRDITLQRPSEEELRLWQSRGGLPLKRFWNTSGLKYRELNLKDRLSQMPKEEQLSLLASDGMLVRRPLLIGEDFVLAGFRQSEWDERFPER